MVWEALRKNPESSVPFIIGLAPALARVITYVAPPYLSSFYEAKKSSKPVIFKEHMEEMILDELETFVDCPGKDVLAVHFTAEKEPLSAKYRIFVADDLMGVIFGQARNMLAPACYIGLPYNINYDSIEDVAKDSERLKITAGSGSFSAWWRRLFGGNGALDKIEWGSGIGIRLMETLLLSKDAKRFLIQRALQQADAGNLLLIDFCSIAGPFVIASMVNLQIRKYLGKPPYSPHMRRPVLWPFYAFSTILAVGGAITARRVSRTYIDSKADELTVSIGEPYARGAIEYYNKLLARNRCINELLEKANLEKVYTKDGDFASGYILRRPETSLKARLKLIVDVSEKAKAMNVA